MIPFSIPVRTIPCILVMMLAANLYAQDGLTDTQNMGLQGPVQSLEERRVAFKAVNGEWTRQSPVRVQKIEFNAAGFKTREWFYGWETRHNTYSYDEGGRLVAREEYEAGRLVFSLETTFDSQGSATLELRYNDKGGLSSKIIRRFEASGRKLSEIHYNARGTVDQLWERKPVSSGSIVNFTPRWEGNEITRFDEEGRITEKYKKAGKNVQKWRYGYDSQSRLAEARFTDNEIPYQMVYTLHYDEGGKLVQVDHSQSTGIPVSTRRYTYTTAGSTATEGVDYFDAEGNLNHTWVYSYNPAGIVVEKEIRHALRPYSCRWQYSYDQDGRQSAEIFYDSQGRIFTMSETTYNERGDRISETKSGRGMALGSKTIYEYDAEGRLLETLSYDLEGHQLSRQSSRYNRFGHQIKNAMYNPDGSLSTSTRFLYEYNELGNWTERSTLYTNNAKESYDVPGEILLRTIIYFP